MSADDSYPRRVFVTAVIAAAVVALAVLAWRGMIALLVTFAGILLAVLLRSLALGVQRIRPMGDTASLAVASLGLLALAAGGAVLLAAPLQEQSAELFDTLPRAVGQLREKLSTLPIGQRLLSLADGSSDQLTSVAGPAAQRVMRFASTTVSVAGYLVLVLFTGLFLAAEPALYRRGLVRLFPVRLRPRLEAVLLEAGEGLQRWLLGRAFLMVVIAIATWIGLLALGIPMALALGVLAGVFTFIPNFGPILAAVPAMLLGVLESPMHVVYVALLYLGIQTAESYTLEPWVMRKADDLPPALVIAAQLFLGVTLGTLGFVLATPLIVVIAVAVRRLYVEDALES